MAIAGAQPLYAQSPPASQPELQFVVALFPQLTLNEFNDLVSNALGQDNPFLSHCAAGQQACLPLAATASQ